MFNSYSRYRRRASAFRVQGVYVIESMNGGPLHGIPIPRWTIERHKISKLRCDWSVKRQIFGVGRGWIRCWYSSSCSIGINLATPIDRGGRVSRWCICPATHIRYLGTYCYLSNEGLLSQDLARVQRVIITSRTVRKTTYHTTTIGRTAVRENWCDAFYGKRVDRVAQHWAVLCGYGVRMVHVPDQRRLPTTYVPAYPNSLSH